MNVFFYSQANRLRQMLFLDVMKDHEHDCMQVNIINFGPPTTELMTVMKPKDELLAMRAKCWLCGSSQWFSSSRVTTLLEWNPLFWILYLVEFRLRSKRQEIMVIINKPFSASIDLFFLLSNVRINTWKFLLVGCLVAYCWLWEPWCTHTDWIV